MIDRDVQAQIGRVCGLLIVLGVVLWAFTRDRGRKQPERPQEKRGAEVERDRRRQQRRESDAIEASREAVRRYLKHPLDADFGWLPPTVRTHQPGDRFSIFGTVKAPNDFGAMLTHQWGTIVVFESHPLTGEQPKVLMVAIDDETLYRSKRLDELLEDRSAPP